MSNSMYLKTVAVVLMLWGISLAAATEQRDNKAQNKQSTEANSVGAVGGEPISSWSFISGGVIVRDYSEEAFAKLEQAAASGTEKEFGQALGELLCPRPAVNVVVTAHGHLITKTAITDSQGKYKIAYLPQGVYEVSAQVSSLSSGKEIKPAVTSRKQVRVVETCGIAALELRENPITVKGRITDVEGKGIAGAKVTGIQEIDDPSSMNEPSTVSTVSTADGSYELQGLHPPDIYRAAGYLNGGDPTRDLQSFYLVIHVEADGFEQGKENTPRIPLVSESLLTAARRLHKAIYQMERRTHPDGPYSMQEEKEGIPFPSSRGNTIADVNIMLKPKNVSM